MKWTKLFLLLLLVCPCVMAQDEEVEDIYGSLQSQGRSSLEVLNQYSWRGTLSNGTPVWIDIEKNWDRHIFGNVSYTRKDGTFSIIPFFGSESPDGETFTCSEYLGGKVVGNWYFELQNSCDLKKATLMAPGQDEKELTMEGAENATFGFGGLHDGLIYAAERTKPLTTFGFITDELNGRIQLSIKGGKATWSVSLARSGSSKAKLSGRGVSKMTGNTFDGAFAGIRFTAYCFTNAIYFDVWRGPDSAFDFKGFFGIM
ncbi:MAG: hypothetical protein KBT12_00695 [Bacteroidales bacterium]|nr:hypothetical protein [Candidatus Physcousia equi]